MLFSRPIYSVLLPTLLGRGLLATAAKPAHSADPCVKVAGLQFADPADAIACQKSFPFSEVLRQNVLTVVSRVFDFYTFEDFYLNSPPPFQESTTDIRAEIARINRTYYATDYDFNLDLWDFTTQLNDGHTRWFPECYNAYQNVLPAPVVILDNGIFIAPNSVDLLNQLGSNFTDYFAAKKFNWQRLAGARVISIGGLPAFDYIDEIARTVSGNFLDHNVRLSDLQSTFSQRVGALAGPLFLAQTSLNFSLIPINSTVPEFVDVPFVAFFIGYSFTDGKSYWAITAPQTMRQMGLTYGLDPAARPNTAVGLPGPSFPTLIPTNGSTGVIKSFILPGNKTGVMFVSSFGGDFYQFQFDVQAAVKQFKASGVTNLLIDVTNNGGGYVDLAFFLHQYLAGTEAGFPGFQSTSRANPLAQKILKAVIHQGRSSSTSFYAPDNWQFLNGTRMPHNFDYNDPSAPFVVNGRSDPTSQRFEDALRPMNVTIPTTPPFDLNNVVIVGNGNCASSCALFTTIMFERHQTKMAIFGGNPSQPIQYKGMAGNQVLEWADLDTEIKTAGLKDVRGVCPALSESRLRRLVSGNMRHNWRSAYSFFDESVPIAYASEPPQYRFPYTAETYNNPQNLWLFA
ncbi:hypothetical protein EI94DRAFT_1771038 [Lactarius quietus]|nr:hypothetical protein EI94DRAFT_1771038 [Lactarius quietus]